MEKGIILLTRIKKEAEQLSKFLTEQTYRVRLTESLDDLELKLSWKECITALLDLDSVSLDNHTIRRLAGKYRQIHFFCMSQNRLHPDLKEAICNHFYACLAKPMDYDELLYWLKCVEDNSAADDGR